MNDEKYRYRRLAYIGVCILLFFLTILIFIFGLATKKYYGNTILIISIVLLVVSLIYAFLLRVIINSLKNRYKMFVIDDAFKTYNFLYESRQQGIYKNKYAIYIDEFNNLNYYKKNDEFEFLINELVVGSIRDIQFRSEDYSFISNSGNTKKCGRIYSLNLKSDDSFKLIITNDDYSASFKKLDLKLLGFNFYTNNIDLANKYIKEDEFKIKIEKIMKYGPLFIEITNSSLYFIIDGIKNSFSIDNRDYNDISNDVEREIYIINNVIDSFKFEFKPKEEKKLKIK